MIRCIHLSEKLSFSIVCLKRDHSTLLYALLMSNFKATNPLFFPLVVSNIVQSFVTNDDVISDQSIWYKNALC